MPRRPRELLRRGAATLGLALLLPGAVVLVWTHSGAWPGARGLPAAAASLCASGAALLLAALALGLSLRLRPPPGAQGGPARQRQEAVGQQEGQRQNPLPSVPPYSSLVSDNLPDVWTVAGHGTPSSTWDGPPLYESVVSAAAWKPSGPPPGAGGLRRGGSDSEATLGLSRLGPELSGALEPLTPPPRYEPAPSGPVFTFAPALSPQSGTPVV